MLGVHGNMRTTNLSNVESNPQIPEYNTIMWMCLEDFHYRKQLHFTEDQFEPRILKEFGKKKLKPNAIPTLFSHRPTVKQEKPPQQEPNIDNSCTATLWLPLNDTSKMRSTTSLSESSSPSQDCLELPDGCYKPVLIEASSQELLECKDKFECTDDDAERK
ncbi:uncharacterized protein LOC142771862 isoform X3 [Rhipicephalus microplus]|uniref:uncharacterized protein LOC142771862 isoform X3 n=1 Tax=Rhipicephalus microplus TaxID=6941 RepID=UPI003F6C24B6